MKRIWLSQLISLACLLTGIAAHAQYVWEYTPRRGEVRFNQLQYKASHNSYERDEPLNAQIDDWNCWMIELDLFLRNGNTILVHHYDQQLATNLDGHLEEIANSRDKNQRFTVLMLEIKDIEDWNAAPNSFALLKERIEHYLGTAAIYHYSEFSEPLGDNSRWPSFQELVRRGKQFALVMSGSDVNISDPYFFSVNAGPNFTSGSLFVMHNAAHGSTPPNNVARGDRGISRAYPSGGEDTCHLQIENGFWDWGLNNGFNFVATNCEDDLDYTKDPRTHSPNPLYVAAYEGDDYQAGTRGFPYRHEIGFLAAVNRASPMVTLKLDPGQWFMSQLLAPVNTRFRITKPMKIMPVSAGRVTIR